MKRLRLILLYFLGSALSTSYGEDLPYKALSVAEVRLKADAGDPPAQFALGWRYSTGDRVKKDKVEGVKWFRKSATQSYGPAELALGISYNNGDGVRKDNSEAAKWFRKAALQGVALAQYKLGELLELGSGVQQDHEEAIQWIRKAAAQGLPLATQALEQTSKSPAASSKPPVSGKSYPVRSGDAKVEAAAGGKIGFDDDASLIIPPDAALKFRLTQEKASNASEFSLKYKSPFGAGVLFDSADTGPVMMVDLHAGIGIFPDLRTATSSVPTTPGKLSRKELVEAWKATVLVNTTNSVKLLQTATAKQQLDVIAQIRFILHPIVDEFLATLETSSSPDTATAARDALALRKKIVEVIDQHPHP